MKRLRFLPVLLCVFSAHAWAQTEAAPNGAPKSTPLCDLPEGCEDEAVPANAHPSSDLKYPDDVKKYFDEQQKQTEQHTQEKQGLAPAPAPVEAPVVQQTPPPAPITVPAQPTRVFGGSSPSDADLDLGAEGDPALRGKSKSQKEKVLVAPAKPVPEQPAPVVQEEPKIETPKVEEKKPEPVKVEPVKVEKPVPVEAPTVEESPKPEVKPVEAAPAPKVEEKKPEPAKPVENFKSDLPEGWEETPTLKEGEMLLEKVKRR